MRRELYHERKAKGLCGRCGHGAPTPGYETCGACRGLTAKYDRQPDNKKVRAARFAAYYLKNKKAIQAKAAQRRKDRR